MAGKTSQEKSKDADEYTRMLETRPVSEFLKTLRKNIANNNNDVVLKQIEAICEKEDKKQELQKYGTRKKKNAKGTQKRGKGKEDTVDEPTLLQLAANYSSDNKVIIRLAKEFPDLLRHQRRGGYEGQTVLHTLISKQNYEAIEKILEQYDSNPSTLLTMKATGPSFVATLLMGELPLTVAALTFNMDMVKLLYDNDALPEARNSEGDTMFHSLVRWAALYPEKLEDVQNMITNLHDWLVELRCTPKSKWTFSTRSVWFIENERGQTALRLAASLALPSLVNLILNLDGVYRRLDKKDGVFDSLEYDVTEIDPVARRIWREKTEKKLAENRVTPARALGLPPASKQMLENSFFSSVTPLTLSIRVPTGFKTFCSVSMWKRTASVLELISETEDMKTAFGLMDNYLMRSIIRNKWFHYRKYYWIWLVLHILWMVLLSTYAIQRAKLIPTPTSNVTADTSDANKTLVDVTAGLTIVGAICLLLAEVALYVRSGQPFAFLSVHYNGMYRLLSLLFSLSLLVDGIWYFAGTPDNNYFLILALLIGWWFLTFFMRPWDGISYYTVLLQKVLLGDMFRFCVVIFLELLSFSLCMYVIYIPADGTDSGVFRGFDHTMLTMFKVMMGLTDLEILYEAPRPWLAIVLFVAFVLLTSLLMLNSLIAMMSNTCSLVSEDRVKQGELQRLSVVLMIEGLLPRVLTWNSGAKKVVTYYDYCNQQEVRKKRHFIKISSVASHGSKTYSSKAEEAGSLDSPPATGSSDSERQSTNLKETTQVKNPPDDLDETSEQSPQVFTIHSCSPQQ